MRILCFTGCMALLLQSAVMHAEDRKFPYEAIVDAEGGENVWSGPGAKYYPTSKLKKGDRVLVRRHDPGGWCMISPPEGSFSWVRAEHVKRDRSDGGSLLTNRVVVHTGSTLNSDDFTTVQADLSKGDAVQILGEKKFSFEDGSHLMLKISPIKGEWRWIPRKSIVAVDAMRSDPYPDDGTLSRKRPGPIANSDSDAIARPVSTGAVVHDEAVDSDSEGSGVRRNQGSEQPGKQRLAAIDQQFREMIKQDPPTWDLDSLAEQYRQLDDDIGTQTMSTTIELRMDAVKRYRKIHQDYVDLYRLTSERKRRDVELMAQQTQFQSPQDGTVVDPRTTTASLDPQPMQPQSPTFPKAAAPAFDGAGIVQRMAKTFSGGPQYVLLAPDGRMLTYLQPGPGVDLNRYVGRSMGIIGRRQHREDWNADTLTVQSLQPVQLRGTVR